MIIRPTDKARLDDLMGLFPVTAILGPRQSGKTTLAHEFQADHFLDLENPRDVALLAEPQLALESLSGRTGSQLRRIFPLLWCFGHDRPTLSRHP